MRIKSSAHAVANLEAISAYIEQDRSLEAANRVARTIYEAVQKPADAAAPRPCGAH